MLKICLFGSLSIERGSDGATPIAGRSANLLAYLALGHGRSFSRSELLGNLWPDGARASASAGSLNTALWRLRRLVEAPPYQHGELIVSDRCGAIGLRAQPGLWLDVEAFERCVGPGLETPCERLGDAQIEDLRRGIQLYKSDILLDVTDDWALREREKYRRNYLNALGRLVQIDTIRRNYPDAIANAQAILDQDALREDVHRELMQLYVLSGQRALALRQFEHCRGLLRRELAIQPMRETLSLYRRIAEGAVGHAPATAPTLPPASEVFAAPPAMDPTALIQAARGHLAAADSQLQMSLDLLH